MIKNLSWELKIFIGLVFTSPLMISGFTFYDELFLIFFLIFFFIKEKNLKINFFNLNEVKNFFLNNKLNILYLLTILYFIIQSFRGFTFFFNFNNLIEIKKLRWIIYFFIIFLLFFIFNREKNYVTKNKNHNIISHTGLLFSVIYLLLSIIFSVSTGNKYSIEYANNQLFGILGTTAYTASLLCLTMPSVFLSLSNQKIELNEQFKYCFFLSFIFCTLFYLGARFGLLFLIIFFILFFFSSLKLKKKIYILLIFFLFSTTLLLLLHFTNYFLNQEYHYSIIDIIKSNSPIIEKGESKGNFRDFDRILLNYIPVYHLFSDFNLSNFLFGTGLRTVSVEIYQTQYELLNLYGINADLTTNFGTTGFATILIETGIIGYLLILILSLANIKDLYNENYPLSICLIPSIFILNLFIINSFDLIIFYILLMPGMIEDIFKINQNK